MTQVEQYLEPMTLEKHIVIFLFSVTVLPLLVLLLGLVELGNPYPQSRLASVSALVAAGGIFGALVTGDLRLFWLIGVAYGLALITAWSWIFEITKRPQLDQSTPSKNE